MKNPRLPLLLVLLAPLFLSGCGLKLFSAQGYVASQSGYLVVLTVGIMMLIVGPVLFLSLYWAWKYREGNRAVADEYDGEWHHSNKLELLIWAVPLLIVIVLGAITWLYTHKLDPYRPLDRINATTLVSEDMQPLEVEVVAMDWKWLFFYPEYGIATVNELAAPVNQPIRFKLTATRTMNSFYVPDLAGMIYAMPGMETQLHAVINSPGVYPGLASHYNGEGFAGMTFSFHGLEEEEFGNWVEQVRDQGQTLGRSRYAELLEPSERDPVAYFGQVDDTLYYSILNRCVNAGEVCMDEIMARDQARMAMNSRARMSRETRLAGLDALLAQDVCTTSNFEEALTILASAPQPALVN